VPRRLSRAPPPRGQGLRGRRYGAPMGTWCWDGGEREVARGDDLPSNTPQQPPGSRGEAGRSGKAEDALARG
jgi:hypothetical protein